MSTRATRLAPRRSTGGPQRYFQLGDRLTHLFEVQPDVWRRHVGTVTDSDALTFAVTWDGDAGIGRYVHDQEPEGPRLATPADEQAALNRNTRLAVAEELRRLAAVHPQWPEPIRRDLINRALVLTERIER